jgi:hypothetical protein
MEMDEQPEQERQQVGLTINAPEKLSHGRYKQPGQNKHADGKRNHSEVIAVPTAEHKEPHRSE